MRFVIDTSTLIVLRKLGWLSLCSLGNHELMWPSKVTRELKRRKAKNKEIFDLLTSGDAIECDTLKPLVIRDISNTDAEVIALAAERNATVISEDALLRAKATDVGLPAVSVAVFVVLLYQKGYLPKDECVSRLKKLQDERFLSKSEYRQLLQWVMQ